jgi:hypothetical protein
MTGASVSSGVDEATAEADAGGTGVAGWADALLEAAGG